MNPLCAVCGHSAKYIDCFYPFHSERNRCEQHKRWVTVYEGREMFVRAPEDEKP
ncbi:hypothetical protein VPH49_09740 [Pseudomonas luteola]|uniref:hypothetical protein n=1 Tax=Pseudomonas luteola TaxID=47886 RepID=UPI003A89BF49